VAGDGVKDGHMKAILTALVIGLLTQGCALFSETRKWDSRIGNYCVHDAARELGTPSRTEKQPNGKTTSIWLKGDMHPAYFTNTYYYPHNTKLSWSSFLWVDGQYTVRTPNPKAGQWWIREKTLNFDSDGYLESWSKKEYDTFTLPPELSKKSEEQREVDHKPQKK
jgi:hypothetical protein